MAPLPLSALSEAAQSAVPLAGGLPLPGAGYNFPPNGPGTIPHRPRPTPAMGAPDVDDVFVVAVSIVVVASLTAFVLIQAITALKEVLDTRSIPLSALSISSFRKHGFSSLNSTSSEHEPLLCASTVSIDTTGCRRNSRWVGPHRCQFTLSPERYDSDTSSTLTRSFSSSSDSTVVGGRICVVYDDTVEPSDGEGCSGAESEDDDENEEEEGGEDQCRRVPLRPLYEPRTRVRRQAIFST